MKQAINIDNFVADYLTTAAWITADSGECTDFTREAKKIAKTDCIKFIVWLLINLEKIKPLNY